MLSRLAGRVGRRAATTVTWLKPWLVRTTKSNDLNLNQQVRLIDVNTISWIEVDVDVIGEYQSVRVNFTNGRESLYVQAASDELRRLEKAFMHKYQLTNVLTGNPCLE